MTITSTGVGSGLDVNALVTQLMSAERAPAETRMAGVEKDTRAQVSAFGALTSSLSALETALKKFDGSGVLAGRKATVADGAGYTATAASSAAPGRYLISVERLAQAHRLQSAAVARNADGSAAQLGYGSLAIRVGTGDPLTVTIGQGAGTLAGIRDAINAQAGGQVSATVVSGDAGDVLLVTSRTTGTDGAVSISASGGDGGLAPLDTTTGTIATQVAAQDAQVVIDGITRTAKGNAIGDAITGVTLNLATAKPGTTFALDIAEDPAPLKATLTDFVNAYNSTIRQLRSLSAPGVDGAVAGALAGDATPRSIQQTLRNAIGGAYADLSKLGLKTAVDGTLTLDGAKFDAALAGDATAVKKLFADNADFGKGLRDTLHNYLGDQGLLAGRRQNLDDRMKSLTRQRTGFESRMERLEASYRRQFTALDGMMAKLQGTSNYIAQQLGSN